MADELKEFVRETIDELLKSLPLEERLKGLSPQERLEGLSTEQVAEALSPDTLNALEALLRQRKTHGPSAKPQ